MKTLAILILLSLCVNVVFASITLESVGIGEDLESAKKDAIANGIREAIGEYTRTKQSLEDDALNEKIINFSNAYVLDYKQLSVSKNDLGLYEIKAQLEIEDGKLVGILKDLNVDVKDVDSGTFKVYVDESHKKDNDFTAMIDDVIIAPLLNNEAWETKILDFGPFELSKFYKQCNASDECRLSFIKPVREANPDIFRYKPYLIILDLKHQKGYLEGIQKLFSTISSKNCSQSSISQSKTTAFMKYAPMNTFEIFITHPLKPDNFANYCLEIQEPFASLLQAKIESFNKQYGRRGKLTLTFLDSQKRPLPSPYIYTNSMSKSQMASINIPRYQYGKGEWAFSPESGLIPQWASNGMQLLKDPPKSVLVVYLTQEMIQNLKEIRADFHLNH